MAIDDLGDIVERVEAARDRFVHVSAGVTALLSTNRQSHRDVQQLASSVGGVKAEARAIRAEIDVIDAVDYLPVADAYAILGAWQWQRALRRDLLRFELEADKLVRIAGELVSGLDKRTIIVRDGETWQIIAARELGDWKLWTLLWQANPGFSPVAPPSGSVLVVPERR